MTKHLLTLFLLVGLTYSSILFCPDPLFPTTAPNSPEPKGANEFDAMGYMADAAAVVTGGNPALAGIGIGCHATASSIRAAEENSK